MMILLRANWQQRTNLFCRAQEGGADVARYEGVDLRRRRPERGNESSGEEHRHGREKDGTYETLWLEDADAETQHWIAGDVLYEAWCRFWK